MNTPKRAGALPRSETFRSVSDDPIKPASIEHGCDEMWFGDEPGPCYNYLDYVFEDASAWIRARAYLDDMSVVTIFPAFLKNSDDGPYFEIEAPELRAGAVAYLRRRYRCIKPDDPPPN